VAGSLSHGGNAEPTGRGEGHGNSGGHECGCAMGASSQPGDAFANCSGRYRGLMMKLILATLVSLVLLTVPAQAGNDSESRTQTIRVVSKVVDFRILVNRPPSSVGNVGDKLQARNSLRNAVAQLGRPKGALVGSDVQTITVTSVTPTRVRVTLTVTLPGGTLRVAGTVTSPKQALPVVGGSGDFAGARGTTEVKSLDADGDPALNIYRLRLP
jgi:hypothetical protein